MIDAWDAYLGTLEGLVETLEVTLAGEGLPVWRAPEPPATPAPPETLSRRDSLLARMVVATQGIERRMDSIRTEIENLPSPRPRPAFAYAGTLGARFDYRG